MQKWRSEVTELMVKISPSMTQNMQMTPLSSLTLRIDKENGIPLCIDHFARFRMEVHSGPIEKKETTKSVVLFCSKLLCMYNDPATFDNANLSDIIIGDKFISIVNDFTYLGSIISRDLSDEMDVNRRIQKAGNAFDMMRKCLFSSSYVKLKIKANVYCTFVLRDYLRTVDLLDRLSLESIDTYICRHQLR